MLMPQRFQVARRLLPEIVATLKGKSAGQGHDLVPFARRLSSVYVEHHDNAPFAIGDRRWRMHAGGGGGAKVEFPPAGDVEFMAHRIIISQQVLSAAHVAEERHNVAIAYWPEIRACIIITNEGKPIIFYKFMHVLPIGQVF